MAQSNYDWFENKWSGKNKRIISMDEERFSDSILLWCIFVENFKKKNVSDNINQ